MPFRVVGCVISEVFLFKMCAGLQRNVTFQSHLSQPRRLAHKQPSWRFSQVFNHCFALALPSRKWHDKRHRPVVMMQRWGLMGLKTQADWLAGRLHSQGEAQLVRSCFQLMTDVTKRERETHTKGARGHREWVRGESFATCRVRDHREITLWKQQL